MPRDAAPPSVGALVYQASHRALTVTWVRPDGERERCPLAPMAEVLAPLERLRDELGDGMALARGRMPRLHAFADDWGRRLLPSGVLDQPPDVLVIVPHGVLHGIPLHLITDEITGRPLGCRAGVTYASSMSLFARAAARNRARHAPTRPRRMAAGGVDVLTGRDDMFQAIPRMLAGLFGDQMTLVETAHGLTRTAIKEAIHEEPDVLVLVAHGHLNQTSHPLSGLLVDPQGDVGWQSIELLPGQTFEFRDLPLTPVPPLQPDVPAEVLTAVELDVAAQLRSELVVLLACSAGSGRVLAADEPASIAETFLRLGAASVIAPEWDADYAATRDWIAAFFHAWLRDGGPKALAGRAATEAMWRELDGDHPERFGALTLRGDWL
jgi:CHAT domain-containing protein